MLKDSQVNHCGMQRAHQYLQDSSGKNDRKMKKMKNKTLSLQREL